MARTRYTVRRGSNADADPDSKYAPGWHDNLGVHPERAEAEAADLEKKYAAQSAPDADYRKTDNAKEIADKESDTVGKGFRRITDSKEFKAVKNRFWNKKRAGIAGTLMGLVVGGGAIGIPAVLVPLEFLHIGSLLHDTHFSQTEESSDTEMGKIFRYLRSGGSIGQTRLSYIGSKYHAQILGELKAAGITPIYGAFDTYAGFTLDTEHEKSPYRGMTPEEAAKAFEAKTGVKPSIEGTRIRVDAEGAFRTKRFVKVMVREMGASKLSYVARVRVLSKFGLANFHIMRPLDEWANKKLKLSEVEPFLRRVLDEKLSGKSPGAPVTVDATHANSGNDSNGDPIPVDDADKAVASDVTKSAAKTESVLKGLKTGGSIAGGVAAVAGTICALRAINESVAAIRYAQIIIPLMNLAMAYISVADQIKSGQDTDLREMQYLAKNFSGTDPATGKTTDWYGAQSIRTNVGDTGGTDSLAINGTRALLTSVNVAWLAWTMASAFSALCSPVGETTTGIISIGLGVMSGALVSTAVGIVAGAALSGPIMAQIGSLLAGEAVKTAVGSNPGEPWGSQVDYGATLAANAANVALGAGKLTSAQSAELYREAQLANAEEFQSKSFLARAFDLSDYRSLTSRMATSLSPSMVMNMNNLFGSVVGAGGAALSAPLKLYSSVASAGTVPQPYDYGFPIFGFSNEEMSNPEVQDPFKNAEDVSILLANTPSYIQRARDCYGVTIARDGQGLWDVIPADDVNVYDTNHYPAECGSSDTSWLKVRFFIFDTGMMEGYACAEFNDTQSCTNNGSASPRGASVLDSATMFQDSSGIACDPRTKDLGVFDGYHDEVKVPIRLCAIPDFPSGSGESHDGYGVLGAEGNTIVNSRISTNIYEMVVAAKAAGVNMSAQSSFRTMSHQQSLCSRNTNCTNGKYDMVAKPGRSNHQMGLAIDFSIRSVSGTGTTCSHRSTAPGDPIWDWLEHNGLDYGLRQYANESWHWDTLAASSRCGGGSNGSLDDGTD